MEKAPFIKPVTSYLIYFVLFLSSPLLLAQKTQNEEFRGPHSFWQQVRFGGSLGLGFGNGYFNGSIAPSAIYDFNAMTSTGLSLSGAYAQQNSFKATSIGGGIIGMFRPIQEIQLSAQYEQLHLTRRHELEGGNLRDSYWVPALFLGIGYNTGPVVTGVRYDVLHDGGKSFYSNAFMPFVSIYF